MLKAFNKGKVELSHNPSWDLTLCVVLKKKHKTQWLMSRVVEELIQYVNAVLGFVSLCIKATLLGQVKVMKLPQAIMVVTCQLP